MMLRPFLNLQLRPKLCSWVQQSRNIRPSIKVAKDRFQLSLDVRQFSKDEIQVKARQEYVVIEGKQEKKTKRGYVTRQFVRKFWLPQGCSPENMESKLSPDGILTITAPRKICEHNFPSEKVIPIACADPQKDTSFVAVPDLKPDPCDKSLKDDKKITPSDKPVSGAKKT